MGLKPYTCTGSEGASQAWCWELAGGSDNGGMGLDDIGGLAGEWILARPHQDIEQQK